MVTKPSILPRWAVDALGTLSSYVKTPPTGKRDVGSIPGEFMPAEWLNWFMAYTSLWLAWLNDIPNQIFSAFGFTYSTPFVGWSYTTAPRFSVSSGTRTIGAGQTDAYWGSNTLANGPFQIVSTLAVPPECTIQAIEILTQNSSGTGTGIVVHLHMRDGSSSGATALTSLTDPVDGSGVSLPASTALGWKTVSLLTGTFVTPANGYVHALIEISPTTSVDQVRVYALRVRYAQAKVRPGNT